MRTTARLGVLAAALAFTAATARAQPPTAPPPHPTLADVVKEYKRLGLPLVPPGAELVRVRSLLDDGHGVVEPYDLAYRVAAPRPGGRDRLYNVIGFEAGLRELEFVEPDEVEETAPTADALRAVRSWDGNGFLTHAVQCRECGWDELAAVFYQRALQECWGWQEPKLVHDELRDGAWRYWERMLLTGGADRRTVLRRLEGIAAEDPNYRNEPTLRQLQRTLAPSQAKPGTPEALIDELVNGRWEDIERQPLHRARQTSLWRLAELGFDAVPALIAHLDDKRLALGDSYQPPISGLTVGNLCGVLLADFSAGTLHPTRSRDRVEIAPEAAQRWFEQARRGGEEKWLIEHAGPTVRDKSPGLKEGCGWRGISLALGAKYPNRLPAVYRAALQAPADKYWSYAYVDYADIVAGSNLPLQQKVTLLEEGVASGDTLHRLYALGGLARVDPGLLRKRLRSELVRMQFRARLGWPVKCYPWLLVRLVDAADDRACRDALVAVCRGASTYNRLEVLFEVCFGREPAEGGTRRAEWVRFMTQFLDDPEVIQYATGTSTAVRDYAAARLEGLLGLREVLPLERIIAALPEHMRTRGAFEQLCRRALVRQAAWRTRSKEVTGLKLAFYQLRRAFVMPRDCRKRHQMTSPTSTGIQSARVITW